MHRALSLPALMAAALLLGCGGTRPATAPNPTAAVNPLPDAERWAAQAVASSADFARAVNDSTRTLSGRPGAAYWQQHASYHLTARLHPDEKRLEGSGRVTYTNNAPHPLTSLRMELALNLHEEGAERNVRAEVTGGMAMRQILVDGEEASSERTAGPRYYLRGTQLAIFPRSPVPAGGSIEIDVAWDLIVPRFGAAGRMGHDNEELFFIAYWYPTMSVYDDVIGWFIDPFLGNAEFYHGFGDYDVTIEVPEGWIIAATGDLTNPEDVLAPAVLERLERARQSDEVVSILSEADLPGGGTASSDGARLRWRFTANQVTDFAFSATRNSLWDAARAPVGDVDGDGDLDYALVNALYRERAPLWRRVVRYGQHALAFLSDFTGMPYPWPHMTAVEASPIETGGMEYPMMTMIGDYNTRGDSALYDVVAHEFGHQWVPMMVSANERRYGWIDEGLTQFVEVAAKDDRRPSNTHRLYELQNYILTSRRGLDSEIMRWSDFHYSPLSINSAVYHKPATVLEALKQVIGEDTFREGYRTFLREWAFRHPYPNDFFATFERVSGRDLSWFWHAWYFETWQLDQAVEEVVPESPEVNVLVRNVGLVPMPVYLRVETRDGGRYDHVFPAEELWSDGARVARLRIPVDGDVIRVEIDPDTLFPDVDRTNNTWSIGSSGDDTRASD